MIFDYFCRQMISRMFYFFFVCFFPLHPLVWESHFASHLALLCVGDSFAWWRGVWRLTLWSDVESPCTVKPLFYVKEWSIRLSSWACGEIHSPLVSPLGLFMSGAQGTEKQTNKQKQPHSVVNADRNSRWGARDGLRRLYSSPGSRLVAYIFFRSNVKWKTETKS